MVVSRDGRGCAGSVAAHAGRAAARLLLACVIVVALPLVVGAPLLVMRAEIAAREAIPVARAAPGTPIDDGMPWEHERPCMHGGVCTASDDAAAPGTPAAPSLPGWRSSIRVLLDTVPVWLPLALAVLVAAPWWFRRSLARRAIYQAPPDDPERFWSVQRRIRPLNQEPAFAWLPRSARSLLTWDVVPQAAFSTFAFGLIAGRMGFELTLALVATVQGAAFVLFLFEHGAVRRYLGLALVRLAALRLADRVRSVADLAARPPGSLCRIRGRVRARRRVTGLCSPEQGAYRLAWFAARTPAEDALGRTCVTEYTLTDETGHDFDLVDRDGRSIRIEIGRAQWLARTPRARRLPAEVLRSLPPGPFSPDAEVEGSEILLRDGDAVEIIGYLDSIVDPTDEHHPRQTQVRLALRGSHDRPLLVRAI